MKRKKYQKRSGLREWSVNRLIEPMLHPWLGVGNEKPSKCEQVETPTITGHRSGWDHIIKAKEINERRRRRRCRCFQHKSTIFMWTYRAVMRWTFLLHLFVSTLFYFIYWFFFFASSSKRLLRPVVVWRSPFACFVVRLLRPSVICGCSHRQPVDITIEHKIHALMIALKMRALPSTHLQSDPSWADVSPFTVTTCSCCVLLLKLHKKKRRKKDNTKKRRRRGEKEEKKRTDITGEICNYVDGTIALLLLLLLNHRTHHQSRGWNWKAQEEEEK